MATGTLAFSERPREKPRIEPATTSLHPASGLSVTPSMFLSLYVTFLKPEQYLRFQPVRYCGGLLNDFDQAKHATMLQQFDSGGSIDIETDDSTGIATLLINNPQKKNAMSGNNNTSATN